MNTALVGAALKTVVAIEDGADMTALRGAVRALAAPLGYDRFVLFSAKATREDVVEHIYWIEGEWFDDAKDVTADAYIRRCPVTRHVVEARRPFFWTKTQAESGDLYRIVATPRGPGIHGLQIPIFGPLGLEGAMSLGGRKIDASTTVRLALSIVASAAFIAARQLLETDREARTTRLSAREREVLSWIAAGRRQTEIAATLQLSERTVENHLRRIRKRLGVATTAEAVRSAIHFGDIES